MRCLITGIDGFVGYHLARRLMDRGDEIIGSTFLPGPVAAPTHRLLQMDITREEEVHRTVSDTLPDAIFHLAGVSNVKVSWDQKRMTLETNFLGAFNVLEAAAKRATRVLVVGSSEQYGPVPPERQPIGETCGMDPRNPYALSKVAQEYLGLHHHRAMGVPVYLVRSFNHSGPRQAPIFVASSFARQIAEIECGRRDPVIYVGNLESRRDFTDVRDTVAAYAAVIDRGEPGEVYNVCSGRPVSGAEILDVLLKATSAKVRVEVDPKRYRPTDNPVLCGDGSKIKERCGWSPLIPLECTLGDLLDFWRDEVRAGR